MYGLTYALKHIVRRKWDSLMKVISLASGIIVGIVLIARIAFDLSYDRWIPDAGSLYRIQSLFTTQTGTDQAETSDYGNTVQPVAPTAAIEIPGVETGTSIWKAGGRVVFHSSGRYETEAIYADTSLFSTIGLEILEGDGSPQSQRSDRLRYRADSTERHRHGKCPRGPGRTGAGLHSHRSMAAELSGTHRYRDSGLCRHRRSPSVHHTFIRRCQGPCRSQGKPDKVSARRMKNIGIIIINL